MKYRLLLKVHYGVVMVWRKVFDTYDEANKEAEQLPNGFVVVTENKVPANADEVPLEK